MRSLGDEIAVLDGLNDLPNEYMRSGVLDSSSGANYSGGSSFAPGLPLLPSNAGLAGLTLGRTAQMTARELQELFSAAGANIGVDGVWGSGSVKAVLAFAVKQGDDSSAREVNQLIRPYAGGRMVLVDTTLVSKMMARVGSSSLGGLGEGIPPEYSMQNVLDASAGANYSGGSSFAPGLPLLPSNAGLADADLVQRYGIAQGVLAPRKNVLDASSGANYSGGSSYAPGLPLLPSNAGLAGNYCGCPLEDIDHYWGSTMGVDNTHYAREGVLDASAGANYSGGSSYSPGLPLLPSNAGLAGLDAVSDTAFRKLLSGQPQMQKAFSRIAAKRPLMQTKVKLARLQRIARSPLSDQGRWKVAQALRACQAELQKQRVMRSNIASGFRRMAA